MVNPAVARRALHDGEFLPYFQPLVDLRSAALTGFEILARWNHPTCGLLSPDAFIPIAERDHWIGDLTACLIHHAFAAAVRLPPSLRLSLNITAFQLHDLELPRQLTRFAACTGFPLRRLTLEVTESALAHDIDQACNVATQLRDLGCCLALDDFGTGFSSLLNLRSLPFDILKIDRSFVRSMTSDRNSRKIVASVVGLGQSLDLVTVAEGVETKEQDEMLLWLGCDQGQGWLYGPAIPQACLRDAVSQKRVRKIPTRVFEGLPHRRSLSQFEQPPTARLAQLRAVYDSAPVGLAFVDRNLRYLTINRNLAEINGIPMPEHLGKTMPELLPEIFPHIQSYIQRALAGESLPEIKLENLTLGSHAGRSFSMSCEPARDEAGEIVGVSLAVTELTPPEEPE